VSCISPEWLVRFHTGYDVDATDWADVSALCERFGIIVPSDYARFRSSRSDTSSHTGPRGAESRPDRRTNM